MRDFILIDFSWLYNRYYHVAKCNNSTSGLPVPPTLLSMLEQFFSVMQKNYKDAKVVVALDSPTSSLKNTQIYEGYKQNRDKESKKEVYACLDYVLQELIKFLNPKVFSFIRAKLYEADQLLAYVVKKYHEKHKIIIYSGDKDLLQLTWYPNTYVSDKFEKGRFLVKSDEEIFEKFKNSKGEDFARISTNKRDILKYRVLKGDTSDNLPPVFPRIKDKEIIELVKNYWIDEEELTEARIYDILEDLKADNKILAEKLEANKEAWLRNYKIMNLYNPEEMQIKRLGYAKEGRK